MHVNNCPSSTALNSVIGDCFTIIAASYW
jgi:hypothetical protein